MILLDANILLEMKMRDRARSNEVRRWFEHQDKFFISMLTVHLVLHFMSMDGYETSEITEYLDGFPKIALTPVDYANAMELLVGADHEDALQLAVAMRTGCTKIATLDSKFAKTYSDHITFKTFS